MKLFDTNLPDHYSLALANEKTCDLAPIHTDKIADVMMTASANFLNAYKKMDHPVALTFNRDDGSVVAAAIVRFIPNENEDDPGNWNLVFTFDEDDIPEGTEIHPITSLETHPYFRSVAGDRHKFTFHAPQDLIMLPTFLLEHIRKWLDENAKENEEVSVEIDGILKARVAVEGGEKVFALEPDGEIKMLIKDDASIEK